MMVVTSSSTASALPLANLCRAKDTGCMNCAVTAPHQLWEAKTRVILGLYRDNGKDNGNLYSVGFRV